MALRILRKIPNDVCLAFSGGVDSLAVAHFLKRGRKSVTLLHFNHGCEFSDKIEQGSVNLAQELDFPIIIKKLDGVPNKGQSIEDFWRRSRYRFMREYCKDHDKKLIVCHHLDDAVETWVWSSLHGEGKLIPVSDDVLIRPFLTTKKQEFINYCSRNNLHAVDDPFNADLHLTRNYMRANMMAHVYKVNPGIDTVIRKKYNENNTRSKIICN